MASDKDRQTAEAWKVLLEQQGCQTITEYYWRLYAGSFVEPEKARLT